MDPEIADQVSKTSNPIEAQHSLLHHGLGTGHDVSPGIEKLHKYVQSLQAQYEAIQGTI